MHELYMQIYRKNHKSSNVNKSLSLETLLSIAAARHCITLCLFASDLIGNPSICLMQYSYTSKHKILSQCPKKTNIFQQTTKGITSQCVSLCVCSKQSGESDIPNMLLAPQHKCLHEKPHTSCPSKYKLCQRSRSFGLSLH